MTSSAERRVRTGVFALGFLTLSLMASGFVWTMLSVVNGLKTASDERRVATEQILENGEERTVRLLKEVARRARLERKEIRADLRELLRQLGLDPSRIPPPEGAERTSEDSAVGPDKGQKDEDPPREDDDDGGRDPQPPKPPKPTPSPSPTPRPTPLVCVKVAGEEVCSPAS